MHFGELLELKPPVPGVQGWGVHLFSSLFKMVYSHLILAFVLISVTYITSNI